MGEVLIILGLVLLWLVARPRRKHRLRKAYRMKLTSNRWVELSARIRYNQTCYRCYTRKQLTVHHVDYLADSSGRPLEPWDPAYLKLDLLRVVCWKCHKKERPARWLRLES